MKHIWDNTKNDTHARYVRNSTRNARWADHLHENGSAKSFTGTGKATASTGSISTEESYAESH